MKIRIFLQSISDVITNSSSEIFCTIFSEEYLDEIETLLTNLFGFRHYNPELYPCVMVRHLEDESEWRDDLEGYPDKWLEVELPYSLSDVDSFFRAGLEAILEKYFQGLYKIVY